MQKKVWIALLLWGMLGFSCSRSRPCTDTCVLGERRCSGQGVASCAYAFSTNCLDWTIVPCPSGYSCQNGLCTAPPSQPPCTNQCKQGQRTCTQTGMVSSCVQNPNTCWSWSAPVPCPTGSTCVGDHCALRGCQDQCKAGERRCSGHNVQTCTQIGGCLQWGNDTPCPVGQSCANAVCVPGQVQCPASCNTDQQCQNGACDTRTQCREGICQTPIASCPTCQVDADCNPSVCGDKTACHQGVCKKAGSFCPPSCTSHTDCQIPACATATVCQNGVCQSAAQCPASCQSDTECSSVPACGAKNSCRSGQCAESFQLTAAEKDLFDALNRARQKNGLPLVTIDEKLTCASRKHANDVGRTKTCGHVGSDGSWPWDRAQACGFPQTKWTVNEIAAGPGFRDGDDAVSGWRQSPGHWDAIVHTQAKSVGVGVYNTCFIALFDCCVKGSD